MREIYAHILEMMNKGEKGILVTVVEVSGSAPRHPGSKMVVHADGQIFGSIGGGKLEKEVIQTALSILQSPVPVQKTYNLVEEEGILCGGRAILLFEPFGKQEHLIIFGAGHIGQALAPLALKADFRVTVVDDRPEFAARERFPDVDGIITGKYPDIFAKLEFNPQTYIVIVTHNHTNDEEVLSYCINKPFAYLGMIGSKSKTLTIIKRLEDKGVARERLALVHSPIGLKIGAETPFEIAISIMAEMIAIKHGVAVNSISMKLSVNK